MQDSAYAGFLACRISDDAVNLERALINGGRIFNGHRLPRYLERVKISNEAVTGSRVDLSNPREDPPSGLQDIVELWMDPLCGGCFGG
jgi:hypothetical protein